MGTPGLEIANITELIFTIITIVSLLNLFILVNYKKLRKSFIVFLIKKKFIRNFIITYFQLRTSALYTHIL